MDSVIVMPDGSEAPSTPMNLRRKLMMETKAISATKARRDANLDSDSPGNIRHARELDELRETLHQQFENELLQRDDDHRRDSLDREHAHDELMMRHNDEHKAEINMMMNTLKTELDEQRALDREQMEATFLDRLETDAERLNNLKLETERLREREKKSEHLPQRAACSGNLSSSVGVCHPAANILADFADCYDLEDSLKLEKKGIVTLFDFFHFLIKEYNCLAQAFVSVSDGASLTSSTSRFKSTLRSLKNPNETTLAILTLLAVDHFCPQISHKTFSILAASASLPSTKRAEIQTGELPVLDSCFANTPFRSLPGITEILSGSSDIETLVAFVLDRVTYVDDALLRLDDSKRSYYSLDCASYTDCTLMFSDEEKRFGICSSWKGKTFIDDTDRAEHLISIIPIIVRSAWAEAPLDSLSPNFTWFKFRSHVQSLWKAAFEKQRLSEKFKVTSPNQPMSPPPQQRTPVQLQPTPPVSRHPNRNQDQRTPSPKNESPIDIEIACRQCSTSFTFTVAQQEHHIKMGYNNQPARCQNCKRSEDSNRLKHLPCFQFQNGNCASGVDCKFSHEIQPPKPVCNVTAGTRVPDADYDGDDGDDEGFELYRPRKGQPAFYHDSRIKPVPPVE